MAENSAEYCIRHNLLWNKLPLNVKQHYGNSQKEYEKEIVNYCIKNQTRYKGSLVRHIRKDEKGYYEELLKYSKDRLMLYPYHLSDVFVKGLRITSFTYYIDIFCELIYNERSYDTLPNFTAADCLQLIGIGRNQYIDIMNRYRSTKRVFSINRRKPARTYLPTQPLDICIIEPWWLVNVGYVTDDDVRQLTPDEKLLVDSLIDNNDQLVAGQLNYLAIQSLYRKGLVYLDVPIYDNDFIQVPPLENFVMNRTLGDYFETLLYKLFVSIDEHTCISELASILQINLDLVKMAVSMYCRLGFAKKTNASYEYTHQSWKDYNKNKKSSGINDQEHILLSGTSTMSSSVTGSELGAMQIDVKKIDTETTNVDEFFMPEIASTTSTITQTTVNQTELQTNFTNSGLKKKRLGFLFDSTLTAFLMMGNLSVGLKNHAVTMFEVGKLSDQSLDNFLFELDKISTDEQNTEGDAQRYFDHARILKSTLQFLRYNKELKIYSDNDEDGSEVDTEPLGVDLLRVESLSSLETNACKRILARNYSILVSMAPYSSFGESFTSPPITFDTPYHIGPIIPEINSVWFKLYLYKLIANGPLSLFIPRGHRLKKLPKQFSNIHERLLITSWGHEPFLTSTQANILLTLNDALAHSPILLQAYGKDTHDGVTVHVAFNDTTHALFQHKILQDLHEKLNLAHFCGYITLLNPSLNNLDTIDSTDSNWRLLEIRFGIPLFDLDLNLKVLGLIKENSLFIKANLNQMLDSSKILQKHLLGFIHESQLNSKFISCHNTDMNLCNYLIMTTKSDPNEDGSIIQTALHPTQCILFDQVSMTVWDE